MDYESYLVKYYSKATVKVYKREIEIYLQNNPNAEKALHSDIVNYIGKLRHRYSNSKTLSRITACIKVYYNYLTYCGKRKDNPSKSIRLRDKISKDIQLQDLFTTAELENLLHKKERYSTLEYRNKVLISLLTSQALKPSEISALTTGDINLETATIYIKGSPKTSTRELTLKPNQVLLFYRYQTEIRTKLLKNKESDIFIIGHRGEPMKEEDISGHVKRIYKGIYGNRKVNCMAIRQSVITNLLKQGNDLRIVQVFAGHKNPSTTEKYKQTDVEVLQMEINKYHPMK